VLGVDASALEEVFGVREITFRTWLCRSGMQGKKLHERFVAELALVHVQLDELWAILRTVARTCSYGLCGSIEWAEIRYEIDPSKVDACGTCREYCPIDDVILEIEYQRSLH
jgi:ferredoxin